MNNKKRLGRPRSFDPDQALQAALALFWAKGYDGTSIKDLSEAMGINGPSLYAAFGDKRRLFLDTIDRYANDGGCAPLVAFEAEADIEAAVHAFMVAAIDYATSHDSGVKGCFLSSCVATSVGTVEGTRTLLAQAIEDTDARLASRFDIEKEAGTLAADFPSLERARLMFDLRQGHVLRARAGLDAAVMKSDLQHRVRMILA